MFVKVEKKKKRVEWNKKWSENFKSNTLCNSWDFGNVQKRVNANKDIIAIMAFLKNIDLKTLITYYIKR